MNKALIVFVIAAILTIVFFVGIEFMYDGHSEATVGLVNEISGGKM
ncbi:hypothetical protein KFZ56_15160 [Virgibacillus sp. NKC19-3]|nr:hypothetical protein [Virgibacillus sp. NKC19-3]MBY7144362.1 hypothetical protein [Virgibacillus sp. NKC19-3]